MEDWEHWISHLDTNGDNSFNPFVDFEEINHRNTSLPLETQDSKCEQIGHPWPHLSSSERNLNNIEPRANQGTKRTRSSSETQDHIMSERKRRQQMAERFIALSAIIPGLKKMGDKYSMTVNELVKNLRQDLLKLYDTCNCDPC